MDKKIQNNIDDFIEKIQKTEYFNDIKFIILYGSALTDYFLDDSDIDICIYLDRPKKELTQIRLNLLKELGGKYDIQMFRLLPLYVRIEVLKGKIIYQKDENITYEIAYDTIERYEDFYPYYSDYINH